jgi:type I restriction-modification system DNA methylase subunit
MSDYYTPKRVIDYITKGVVIFEPTEGSGSFLQQALEYQKHHPTLSVAIGNPPFTMLAEREKGGAK